jgi:hypothetical protein
MTLTRRVCRTTPRFFAIASPDNASRDKALPAIVLAHEHENRVVFGYMLTPIHSLLRGEREPLRPRIADLGSPLPPQNPRRLSFGHSRRQRCPRLEPLGVTDQRVDFTPSW